MQPFVNNTWMRAYLGLGSNLENREDYLRSAVRQLSTRPVDILQCSSVYSTEPRDLLDQPWFLNAVLYARTDLSARSLLAACLEVERENLRERGVPKGPRTLDIDILFYGTEIIREPDLTIPHARFSERRFVLAPMVEIAPAFVDPVTGKTMRELLDVCPDTATVVRVYDAQAFFRLSPSEPQ
jgi:2-amino-4-hydroxy-6-hydroxymethyldihydropteridine diphosphokinase